MNCGLGSSDDAKTILSNRNLVAEHMGTSLENIVGVHQIHSVEAIICNGTFKTSPKADALVTNTRGLLLSVLTADCQPVIFADRKNSVIGIAHAGWRGALNGVLNSTVNKMEASILFTVEFKTPLSAPRQPACAIPITLFFLSAKITGWQSAVKTESKSPRVFVTRASAFGEVLNVPLHIIASTE